MLSIQPDLIEYKTELFSKISKNIYIIAGILVVVCILLLLIFSNSRQFLRNIDMYTQQHNYEEDQPIYIRKTLIGGVFTTAFIFAALAIGSSMLISYGIDNIRETKGLVPYAALEQEYENVIFI
jgi:Ca2+/Na+ antiporter